MTRDSSNYRQTARTHHTARSPAFFSQTSQFPCNLLPNPMLHMHITAAAAAAASHLLLSFSFRIFFQFLLLQLPQARLRKLRRTESTRVR